MAAKRLWWLLYSTVKNMHLSSLRRMAPFLVKFYAWQTKHPQYIFFAKATKMNKTPSVHFLW